MPQKIGPRPSQEFPLSTCVVFLAPQRASLGPKVAHTSSANQPAWLHTAFGKARGPLLANFMQPTGTTGTALWCNMAQWHGAVPNRHRRGYVVLWYYY
jgi:hypothetical protein